MKRLIAGALALAALAPLNAETILPEFFSENFRKMGIAGDFLTDDWTTYGNGAMPIQVFAENYFLSGENPPYYVLLNYENLTIPISCTNFDPPQAADQWLVSPEIEIPSDNCMLSFTGCVYTRADWGQGSNPYKVLVSESGIAREDFSEVPVIEGTVKYSRTQAVATKSIVTPLLGYGGKKVHLAFVSTGEDLGLTGFTDISLGQYAATLDNKTPGVAELGTELTVSVNMGLKTPVACPGLKAVLEINGKQVEETYYTKDFGKSGTSLIYQLVKFAPIQVTEKETLNYTVRLTPDYDGAPESVVTGSVGVPTITYPTNVVIEEVTATGCQACVTGIASMEYYHDVYGPGTPDGCAVPIAIHGYIDYYDPMSAGTAEYLNQVQALNATTAYPSAMFNRATRGLTPDRISEFVKVREAGSFNLAEVVSVESEAVGSDEPWGKEVKVSFRAKNAFDAQTLDLKAAVVMVENNVRGNDKGYNQTNGLYKQSESYIETNYDLLLKPYLKEYLPGGEFGYASIPFSKMTYQHVARGIFPSFFGEDIQGSWTEDVWKDGELSFTVPENVIDINETQVIVLIIDGTTQQIVASATMDAADFTKGSGVGETRATTAVSVGRTQGGLKAVAANDATIEVLDLSGRRLAFRNLKAGEQTRIEANPGAVIVRILSEGQASTLKLML